MKYINFIVFLVVIMALSACDGRDRLHKSPQEILQENKLLDSFSEHIKYIPESYTEIITDTLFSNGFRVKIKTFSNATKAVLSTKKIDNINHKTYYREFKSEVAVFKNKKRIFFKLIDKSFFVSSYPKDKKALKEMILHAAHVKQSSSLEKEIDIVFSYKQIKTTIKKQYQLVIKPTGKYKITSF